MALLPLRHRRDMGQPHIAPRLRGLGAPMVRTAAEQLDLRAGKVDKSGSPTRSKADGTMAAQIKSLKGELAVAQKRITELRSQGGAPPRGAGLDTSTDVEMVATADSEDIAILEKGLARVEKQIVSIPAGAAAGSPDVLAREACALSR